MEYLLMICRALRAHEIQASDSTHAHARSTLALVTVIRTADVSLVLRSALRRRGSDERR